MFHENGITRVREVLVELGAKVSLYDHLLFIWFNDTGQLIGLLVSHVDDFVYCGILHWHDKVIGQLIKPFRSVNKDIDLLDIFV